MPYIKKNTLVRARHSLRGFGDFTDESLCSSIPAGDSYRKPGNYCNTGDGGYTTFNADGSTYSVPGSTTASSSSPGFLDSFLTNLLGQGKQPVGVAPIVAPGMSTTTKIAIAGGAVLLAAIILRR